MRPEVLYEYEDSNLDALTYSGTEIWLNVRKSFCDGWTRRMSLLRKILASSRYIVLIAVLGTLTASLSAYMRFSFAFSASSSFIRFSSETLTPPYFARQLK